MQNHFLCRYLKTQLEKQTKCWVAVKMIEAELKDSKVLPNKGTTCLMGQKLSLLDPDGISDVYQSGVMCLCT